MNIKTLQWNIGGGKTKKSATDVVNKFEYPIDGIENIANRIKELSPDVITLQEIHIDSLSNQAQFIADKLNL